MVARLLWEQDAAGSNPVTSTKKRNVAFAMFRFLFELQVFKLRYITSKASACFGLLIQALPVADKAKNQKEQRSEFCER